MTELTPEKMAAIAAKYFTPAERAELFSVCTKYPGRLSAATTVLRTTKFRDDEEVAEFLRSAVREALKGGSA